MIISSWIALGLLSFLRSVGMFFASPFVRSSAIIFSNTLLSLLYFFSPGTPLIRLLEFLILSYKSLFYFYFYVFLFHFLCCSYSVKSVDLSSSLLILSSVISILLLSCSNKLFISVIVFFSSIISI